MPLRDGPIVSTDAPAQARQRMRRRMASVGYAISQKIRKRVEEIFGWFKTIGGLARSRLVGRWKMAQEALVVAAAYNLTCKAPRTNQIVNLFGQVLDSMPRRGGTKTGLFLVIDELGKLLEYAAENPSGTDLYLLQALAEYAARSRKPFYILVILHQDFSACAKQPSRGARRMGQDQ